MISELKIRFVKIYQTLLGVQPFSLVWQCDPIDCRTLGFPHPLLSSGTFSSSCHLTVSFFTPFFSCLLSFPPSRVFSNESVLPIKWPKYWNFSFSISPSNESSGIISFRIDWLDLLAVQGSLKNLLQLHSSKASIFQHSAFFMVQLSHPYMTTWIIIALTIWNFVGKVKSLLLELSTFVIALLPRRKHLLISWL